MSRDEVRALAERLCRDAVRDTDCEPTKLNFSRIADACVRAAEQFAAEWEKRK